VEADFDVDVHSFYPCSFLLLSDLTHPLSME
jgi:hypothetical protein